MQYGCIGETLKHSFSAEIHPLLTEHTYELCEIAKEDLDAFMQKRDFCGINVTIPYKTAVIPHLYELDEQARVIGAVNTVVNRDGKLYGYNTDFYGMRTLLNQIGADLLGKKVAVLGTGGTSKTAVAVANSLGAREVLRVSRSGKDGAITYDELRKEHNDIEAVINTTPVGMYPHANETPLLLDGFDRLCYVADVVYNPLRTRLILDARERGIAAEGGLLMLVAQAVRASEIFHDCTYAREITTRIWQQMMRKKENIVLIGMPACGKTTVGKLLAENLGRRFCDMDEEITNAVGRTPAQIIREDGEPTFREIETQILKEKIASRTGEVIATGGGAILKKENVRLLRQNGRLFFLDRPWQKLVPTSDRPLSGTAEQIERRYRERYSLYCEACDVRIEDPDTAESAAERIGKDFKAL